MRCNRVRKELLLIVDNPGEIKPEVAAHLASCASCRREFALLQQMTGTLRTRETVQAPAGFSARVMARITAGAPAAGQCWRERLSGWKRRPFAAAAALMLIAGSALAMFLSGGPRVPEVATKLPITEAVSPMNRQPTEEVGPAPESGEKTVEKNTPATGVPEKPENTPESEGVTPQGEPQPSGQYPGKAMQGNGGTVTPPGETQSPEQPAQVAQIRPPVVFLSQQRILTSTVMRIQVRDLEAAKENALSTARSWGASHTCTVTAIEGVPRIEILQFVIDKENRDGFLIVLSGLGTVIDRSNDEIDQTQKFNKQKAEYETLLAARNHAPEEERGGIDAKLNEIEKELAELDVLTGKHIVTLCLVEK